MKKLIQAYRAVELSKLENKTKPTIYNNGRLYIPIKIASKRSQKGYSIRYIKKSDLDHYLWNMIRIKTAINSIKELNVEWIMNVRLRQDQQKIAWANLPMANFIEDCHKDENGVLTHIDKTWEREIVDWWVKDNNLYITYS